MPVVIPELVYIIGLLFAVLGYMAARGMLATWTHTIGYLLEALAGALRFKIPLGFGRGKTIDLGGPVRALDKLVITAIQNWCVGAEIEMGYCLHGLEKVGRYMAQAIDYGFRETAQTFDWLVHIHLPKWARYALLPLLFPLLLPKLIAAVLPHIRSNTVKTIHTVTHDITHTITKVVHRAEAVALPSPWAFPKFRTAWHELEAWRKVTARRLKRLELLLAASGLALAVANMTGTRVGCWRGRGNIARTLRHICGVPTWLVDLLVIGAVEAFIVSDLCGFSNLLIKEAESLRPALLELVDVEDALIGCGGTVKPIDFDLAPLSLPPMFGPSALAA